MIRLPRLDMHMHTLEFEKLCNHDMFFVVAKVLVINKELTLYFNHLLYRMHCC